MIEKDDKFVFDAEQMRVATARACDGLDQEEFLEIRKTIVETATKGITRVNIGKIECGVDEELRRRGFIVVEPDDKVAEWTISWSPPKGTP